MNLHCLIYESIKDFPKGQFIVFISYKEKKLRGKVNAETRALFGYKLKFYEVLNQ